MNFPTLSTTYLNIMSYKNYSVVKRFLIKLIYKILRKVLLLRKK